MRLLANLCAVIVLSWSAAAAASTGFHLGNGLTRELPGVYGISTGWYYPVQAVMTANAVGLQKLGENFEDPAPPLSWVSRYGSVTQTMHGYGFPMSGVNEAGLVIQATVLRGYSFPPVPAGAIGLHCLQWIQFHLDTSATLEEVIAKSLTSPKAVFPQGPMAAQYQVCDSRNCAVIAFYDHKAVAQGSMGRVEVDLTTGKVTEDRSQSWLLAAITNHPYDQALAAYQACRSFPCPNSDDSLDRFIKAAQMVRSFVGYPYHGLEPLLDSVMTELPAVDQGLPLTTWNEAYGLLYDHGMPVLELTYKSPKRPLQDRQWIRWNGLHFDCRQPVATWPLEMDRGGGDRSVSWQPLTRAMQESLIRQHAKTTSEPHIQAMTAYPWAKTKCLSGAR